MKLWSHPQWALSLRAAAALLVACFGLTAQAADPDAESETRISVNFESEPLGDALDAVVALTGWPIEVIGSIPKRRVSVLLRDATLEESLHRVLYPSSYIVFWSSEGRLVIHVLDAEDDQETGELQQGLTDPTLGSGAESEEVALWDDPGDPGRPEEFYEQSSTDLGVADDEVLPPGPSETVGITQDEIDFFGGQEVAVDTELLPPETEGEFGITLEDLDLAEDARPVLAPSEDELLPPDEPGVMGITVEDLNRQAAQISQSASNQNSAADLFPPD